MSGENLTIQSSVAQTGTAAKHQNRTKVTADSKSKVFKKHLSDEKAEAVEKMRDSRQENNKAPQNNDQQENEKTAEKTILKDSGIIVDTKA